MASSVGIREAKIHLSQLMKKVQRGMEIVITDRGRPVGKIIPLRESKGSLAERIGELEIQGVIEERKHKSKPLPPPIPVGGIPAQKFLQESRNRG